MVKAQGGIEIDDTYLFAALIYLLIAVLGAGLIPSTVFAGEVPTGVVSASELQDSFNTSAEDVDGLTEQVGFFKKLLAFLFVTWTIEGIPTILGLFIFVLNLFAIIIPIVWLYDKLRGIGS